MKRKSYIRTPEILEKQRKAQLGHIGYNKGMKVSQIVKDRISKATKKAMTPEICRKVSLSKIGKICSEEHKRAISLGNKGKTRGNKHYKWKGNYEINKQVRSCFEYRQWRSDVFTKDDYTCQDCGEKGKKLQAHHIKPFSIILEEYNIKILADALNCSELWDINNGKTLCIPCHKKTDTYSVNKKWIPKK